MAQVASNAKLHHEDNIFNNSNLELEHNYLEALQSPAGLQNHPTVVRRSGFDHTISCAPCFNITNELHALQHHIKEIHGSEQLSVRRLVDYESLQCLNPFCDGCRKMSSAAAWLSWRVPPIDGIAPAV